MYLTDRDRCRTNSFAGPSPADFTARWRQRLQIASGHIIHALAYTLALIPAVTDWLETGHLPATPREYITEIVLGIVIALFRPSVCAPWRKSIR